MNRIMVITDLYPHRYNLAAGIFVKHQLTELSKHYKVFVLATCDKYPVAYEHCVEEGITVTRIYYPYWQKYFLSSLLTYPLFVIPILILSCLRWKPDIIHVHDYRHVPELVWIKLILKSFRKSRYLTLHNIRTHPDRLDGNPLKCFYKQGLSFALSNWTHIFTVNRRLADWVYSQGYSTNNVSIIGNGIHPHNPTEFTIMPTWAMSSEQGSFNIISVGNLVPEKGFDILIKAVHTLVAESYNIRLLIVGDGCERTSLVELIAKLALQNSVHLAGVLANDYVRNLYPLFQAFVLPSYSESFGIVYIEAMYAGLPIIGIEGEGIYGMFDDGTEALFAKAKDVDDLAGKIRHMINNPQLCKSMGEASGTKVRNQFMMKQLIDKVIEVYER